MPVFQKHLSTEDYCYGFGKAVLTDESKTVYDEELMSIMKEAISSQMKFGYVGNVIESYKYFGLPTVISLKDLTNPEVSFTNYTIGNQFANINLKSLRVKIEETKLKSWGFELENSIQIIQFLFENPSANTPLMEAKQEISKYFPDPVLKLSLYKDEEENYEVLNIVILNNLPTTEAFKMENLLFDNWFEKHYLNLKGKVGLREYPL